MDRVPLCFLRQPVEQQPATAQAVPRRVFFFYDQEAARHRQRGNGETDVFDKFSS